MWLAALTWVIIISSSFVFLLYNYKRAFDFNLLVSLTLNSREWGGMKGTKWLWLCHNSPRHEMKLIWNWKDSQSLSSSTHISSYLSCSAGPCSSLPPGMLVLHPPVLPPAWFYSTFLANGWNKDISFRFSAEHFKAHPDHLKKPKPLTQNVLSFFFFNS